MIDQDLLTEIQYALIEPPDGGASFPSGIWTRAEVIEILNNAQQDLLQRTHLVVQRTEIGVLAGATAIDLPTDWLATGHLVWRAADGTRIPLGPIDTTEIDLALPTWETVPGDPIGYLDSDTDTLKLRLGPIPATDGTIELLYIAVPPDVNGHGRSFVVPEEYLSGVKYNCLGSLLAKVGRLQDPTRAAYCQQRFDLTVLAAQIILGGGA